MVFVTGGTGLIGSYLLVELAKRGEKIRAMKRKNSSLTAVRSLFEEYADLELFEKIDWVEAELGNIPKLTEALQGIETLYHTAAHVGFDDRSRKDIQRINIQGTENLVNLAISESVPNFVYVSSISVLDESPGETIITENSKWDPEKAHSEYAISKKKGEMNVWRGSQEGLNVLVVYPSVVIGSLDGTRASEKIFKLAYQKNAFATDGKTGYVDVRDVAKLMVELVHNQHWNQGFILNSGEKSFVEIFNYLRKKKNLSAIQAVSRGKLKGVKFFSQFSKILGGPYMSKASYHALTGTSIYSTEKIQTNIQHSFISIEEALDFHSAHYLEKQKQQNA
jgi:dihydroflavonol-4-reductase